MKPPSELTMGLLFAYSQYTLHEGLFWNHWRENGHYRGDHTTSLLYNHMSAAINVLFVFLFILEDYIVFGKGGPDLVPGGFRRESNLVSPLDDAAVQRSNQVHLDTITTSFPLSNFHSSALRSRSPWPPVSLPSFSRFSSHFRPQLVILCITFDNLTGYVIYSGCLDADWALRID
jgi:hypothetical protein